MDIYEVLDSIQKKIERTPLKEYMIREALFRKKIWYIKTKIYLESRGIY